MTHAADPSRSFAPRPGQAGAPLAFICFVFWVWLLWATGLFTTYRSESLLDYLERAALLMLATGIFPLLGLLALVQPLHRAAHVIMPPG